MSSIYEVFGTDENLETQGIEIDYGDGIVFKVARAGGKNTKYKRAIETLTKPHRRAIQSGVMTEQQGNVLLQKAFARSVILGWEGVTDEDGVTLPFNEENFLTLMNKLPDLWEDLHTQANNLSLYRQQSIEEDSKN